MSEVLTRAMILEAKDKLDRAGEPKLELILTCRVCKRRDVESRFRQHAISVKKKTGTCKKCHNEYSNYQNRVRRAKKMKDLYRECNTCSAVFSIYGKGYPQVIRYDTVCADCNSEDIRTLDHWTD